MTILIMIDLKGLLDINELIDFGVSLLDDKRFYDVWNEYKNESSYHW